MVDSAAARPSGDGACMARYGYRRRAARPSELNASVFGAVPRDVEPDGHRPPSPFGAFGRNLARAPLDAYGELDAGAHTAVAISWPSP